MTKAQHCHADDVPDRPGLARRSGGTMQNAEEPPGNLAVTDPKIERRGAGLFGAWETNWIAYNSAHDIALPGSSGPKIAFLMYPRRK